MRRWNPNPSAIARIQRSRIELVPDPVEPDPHLPGLLREPPRRDPGTAPTSSATRPRRPGSATCGHCQHGFEGHGSQYGALVGWHTWAPVVAPAPKNWSEIRSGRFTEEDDG